MDITNMLTWESIHAWVEQADDTEPIGHANSCTTCPVVRYIQDATGSVAWGVGHELFASGQPISLAIVGSSGAHTALPDWLQRVVKQVDRDRFYQQAISKQAFLSILEKCKPDIEDVQKEIESHA